MVHELWKLMTTPLRPALCSLQSDIFNKQFSAMLIKCSCASDIADLSNPILHRPSETMPHAPDFKISLLRRITTLPLEHITPLRQLSMTAFETELFDVVPSNTMPFLLQHLTVQDLTVARPPHSKMPSAQSVADMHVMLLELKAALVNVDEEI
jgi:hypothetical protein